MRNKLTKLVGRVALVFGIYLSGPIFLLLTNPTNLPLPLLIVPYFWLFCVFCCSLVLVYRYVLGRRLSRRIKINIAIASVLPVLLAILQSIHQLSIKDILLVLGLLTVASLYVSKLDLGASSQ